MRAIKLMLLLGALAAVLAVPTTGSALHGSSSGECTGAGSCSASFTLSGSGFVSNVDSHGNYHDLLLEPGRTVTVEWFDSTGLVFSSVCSITGLSAEGVGPLDAQNATCTNAYARTDYVPGAQTLVVTGTGTGTVHGALTISAGDALL